MQASGAVPSRGGGARGADWQSGRRRPGNGSGFSGGVTRREGAAAAAAAAENAAESRAGGRASKGASAAATKLGRRGVCARRSWPGAATPFQAGGARAPRGRGFPPRSKRSQVASEVWWRKRQARLLSSSRSPNPSAARGRHARAPPQPGVRVKPRTLAPASTTFFFFFFFLRGVGRLLHPDPRWARGQTRSPGIVAIQGNRRVGRLGGASRGGTVGAVEARDARCTDSRTEGWHCGGGSLCLLFGCIGDGGAGCLLTAGVWEVLPLPPPSRC